MDNLKAEAAKGGAYLDSELYPRVRDGPNEAAAQISVDTTQMICHEVVKNTSIFAANL